MEILVFWSIGDIACNQAIQLEKRKSSNDITLLCINILPSAERYFKTFVSIESENENENV